MLNIQQTVRSGLNIITDNAPAILTAFGAVGVVGTGVLTARATFEAAEQLREAQVQKNIDANQMVPLTKTEKVKEVWPLYIAPVSTGALSIAAIVMSHRISSKRAAMLAAAYALNQEKLEEYQEKMKEKLGIKKEKDARDEIQQERVTRTFEANAFDFFAPGQGKVWMMEAYTGRPFLSTKVAIEEAVNEVNALLVSERAVRLSDFYDLIGLDHVSTSDYFGFTYHDRLELDWTTTTSPDGQLAVHVFDYVNPPVMNPEREATFR